MGFIFQQNGMSAHTAPNYKHLSGVEKTSSDPCVSKETAV